MTRRALLLASVALCTLAGAAAAKPAAGFAPAPRPFEIVESDSSLVELHLNEQAGDIIACADRSRASFVRLRIRLAWDRAGRVRSVAVSGGGRSVNRCVGRALRDALPTKVHGAGRGRAAVVVRRIIATPRPPTRPSMADLQQCRAASDCVIHFQQHACVAGEPIAVNVAADPRAVQSAFPVKTLDCAMGGPQFDRLMMQNEGRYSATCEHARCVVVDAGPRKTVLDL